MTIARVLTIAGSAAHGSAGIQADLKTFQERDVYGMAAITAIVTNNPTSDKKIFIQDLDAIKAQYLTSTERVGVDAIKTGMLFSTEIIELVSDLLKNAPTKNIVVDPVMIGKMGSQLLNDDAIESVKQKLIPLATIITPNAHEAARLLNQEPLTTISDLKDAARELYKLGPNYVLVKGGSISEDAVDILFDGNSVMELKEERIETIHTSGAGCSLSAAIASEIAKGLSVEEAVKQGKKYVHAAIKHSLTFNRGIGSTYHAALRKYRY